MTCFEDLKAKGYRLTPQRLMVLKTLHEAKEHITAPEIYNRVRLKYPWINKSTVYRALELLKTLDLVTETELGGDRLYYHHAEKGHHHHLICQKCQRVIDIDESFFSPLEDTLRRKYRFQADLRHLGIQGHCLRCKG
ncbi:MAG: transcriptional repressor [Chloroflexi bacterium]|nr:transcriptional repressor [Chloroflexota bacterium]